MTMDLKTRRHGLAILVMAIGAAGSVATADPPAMPPHAMATRPVEGGGVPNLPLSVDELPTPNEPWQLRLWRDACFGPCAVYDLVIHDDGSVGYNGYRNVERKGAQQGQADPVALKALRKRLQRPSFSKLVGDYWVNSPSCGHWTSDMAKVVIAVWSQGRWQLIKHDYGCHAAPHELHNLEDQIDKAARTKSLGAS